MKIRTATLTIAALALVGLTACTPEELQQAITFSDARSFGVESVAVAPVAGSVDVVAACDGLSFTIAGWPEGSDVFIGLGSQPPIGFTVGADNLWGFVELDGGASGFVPIAGYDSLHSFDWIVDIDTAPAAGSNAQRVQVGTVECPAE